MLNSKYLNMSSFDVVFSTSKTDRHDITEILLKDGAKYHQTNKQYIMYYFTPLLAVLKQYELTTSVVIGTDYIGSCKSNYHAAMATTAPYII
jgi:hypothetical protein